MLAPIFAGSAYFATIFALGFVLGAARVAALTHVPGADPVTLVLVELPVVLAASWVVCGAMIRRFAVPSGRAERLVMGGVAFGLLMLAEAALGLLLLGRSLAEHLASYRQPAQALGLLAQLVFGLFPLLRGRRLFRSWPSPG